LCCHFPLRLSTQPTGTSAAIQSDVEIGVVGGDFKPVAVAGFQAIDAPQANPMSPAPQQQ